jgi:hypothetical protein
MSGRLYQANCLGQRNTRNEIVEPVILLEVGMQPDARCVHEASQVTSHLRDDYLNWIGLGHRPREVLHLVIESWRGERYHLVETNRLANAIELWLNAQIQAPTGPANDDGAATP